MDIGRGSARITRMGDSESCSRLYRAFWSPWLLESHLSESLVDRELGAA